VPGGLFQLFSLPSRATGLKPSLDKLYSSVRFAGSTLESEMGMSILICSVSSLRMHKSSTHDDDEELNAVPC